MFITKMKMIMDEVLSRALGHPLARIHNTTFNHNAVVNLIRSRVRRVQIRRHRTTRFRPNGAQECARRVRQIGSYQLTGSNGLIVPVVDDPGKFVTGNGNGGLCYWPS